MENGILLAIEGGGSTTRVVVGSAAGQMLRERRGGPGSALYVDAATYPDMLNGLIDDALAGEAACPGRIGFAGPMNRALLGETLAARFPGVPQRWYSEGEIALGVYGLPWGVSVVAGTGSSARVLAPDGSWLETGGFGPQFDDLGSGYWIAREGIEAVLRAEHARAPETALRERMFAHFDIEKCWDLIGLCEGNGHLSVPRVARFAAEVTACAASGDAVASEICAAAGRHLAELVVVSVRRAGLGTGAEDIPVVPTGGVFRAGAVVLEKFAKTLRDSGLRFEVFAAIPDPVIGLVHLLAREEEHR